VVRVDERSLHVGSRKEDGYNGWLKVMGATVMSPFLFDSHI